MSTATVRGAGVGDVASAFPGYNATAAISVTIAVTKVRSRFTIPVETALGPRTFRVVVAAPTVDSRPAAVVNDVAWSARGKEGNGRDRDE